MSLKSYKLTRKYSYSDPRREMLREKNIQINELYEFAMDREDETLLNGKPFIKSPRIFDRKFIDTFHHKITVETVLKDDWIECGDYLQYDDMTWLCLNSYSFHNLYCRATFMSCDWHLYWCDKAGNIKDIWCVDQNSTQYNSGESESKLMTLGSAQHMLKVQCNDDTVAFDSPMRFYLDKNINNPTCYMVTQNDNTSYNYGKGLCCITVTQCEADISKDKQISVDNNAKVWIADYIEPSISQPINPAPTGDILSTITGRNDLRLGYKRKYTVAFTDNNGNDISYSNVDFNWNIVSDFNKDISKTILNNTIELSINNGSLVDESFLLQIIIDGKVNSEMVITIKGLF